jgi:hypothetical protein
MVSQLKLDNHIKSTPLHHKLSLEWKPIDRHIQLFFLTVHVPELPTRNYMTGFYTPPKGPLTHPEGTHLRTMGNKLGIIYI